MRRILQALIIDPKRITDHLIDERQAAATRPGALEAFRAFGRNSAILRENPVYALQNDMTKSLPTLTKAIRRSSSGAIAIRLRSLRPDVKSKSNCPMRSSMGARAGHQVQPISPMRQPRSFALSFDRGLARVSPRSKTR